MCKSGRSWRVSVTDQVDVGETELGECIGPVIAN
jgi:hypothetical protein